MGKPQKRYAVYNWRNPPIDGGKRIMVGSVGEAISKSQELGKDWVWARPKRLK